MRRVLGGLMVAAVALVLPMAGAGGGENLYVVTPNPAVAGETMTVTGTDCGESVEVVLFPAGDEGSVLASGTAEGTIGGNWSVDVDLPADLPAGDYLIEALCTTSAGSPDEQTTGLGPLPLSVLASTATPTPTPTPTPTTTTTPPPTAAPIVASPSFTG